MQFSTEQPHDPMAHPGHIHCVTSLAALAFSLMAFVLAAPAASSPETIQKRPPFGTYSIVARDPVTKQIGVAVQSHFFAVGTIVTWAWPGVGAVATQANGAARFGPQGLAMLADGIPPQQAIAALLASDSLAETRQVGMVDAQGRSHAYTGERVISDHCHRTEMNLSIQANIMVNPGVCEAMAKAFKTKAGDLAARLFAALKAAQAVGGDLRGEEAAALLVVESKDNLPRWGGRLYDIRVDDSQAPLRDLGRMITVARNMNLSNAIQADIHGGRLTEAADKVRDLLERVGPDNENFLWIAIAYAAAGDDGAATALLKKLVTSNPKWRKDISRLIGAGYLPDRQPFAGLTPKTSSADAPSAPSSRAPSIAE